MDYNIAIPSYNRAEVLNTKTLPMLKRYNIDPDKITVFCANKQEAEKYKDTLDKSLYGKIVVGHKGVKAIRNFITRYYPKNAYVISLDDDIDGFDTIGGTEDKPKWEPIGSFKKDMIERGKKLMEENNYHIWGIYPNRNNGYASKMKPYSTDLKFLIGHCFGFINQKVMTHIDYKEDYERSLEYAIKDGGVIRFNHICAKTKFGIPGGVGKSAKERVPTYHKEVEFLINKYPTLVRKNSQREGEILLARSVKTVRGSGKAVQRTPASAQTDNTERKILSIRNKARYEKAKEKLLGLLRQTTIPPLGKPSAGGYNRANKLGSVGRTMTLGFGDTRHGIKEYSTNRQHPELLRALAEFGNIVVPLHWDYNGITLNEGVKANKHKDSKNLGPSVIIGIGDFTGGDIKVWDKDDADPKIINLHDQPVMFNGGLLYHQTTPFKGERYTMVFYKQMWEGKVKGIPMEGAGYEDDTDLTGGIFA
jgi:hypothetical protein